MSNRPPFRYFFYGQRLHLFLLVVLLVALLGIVDHRRLARTSLLGLNGLGWFWIAAAVPVWHQVFVVLAWRTELCFGVLTRCLGRAAFPLYAVPFLLLLVARPASLLMLAVCDAESLPISWPGRAGLCVLLSGPAAYASYSVVRHFGILRATGADHFDSSYRNLPLATEGVFRFTNNPMYVAVFLWFWVIAIALASRSALAIAAFNHAYIWVHYGCTERPDMARIYGPPDRDQA